MPRQLAISLGQYSDKGVKATNQDFHGALIPDQPLLGLKGIAIALADGISSSTVSEIASETAVKSFLTDYYCTSDTWSVKTSASRVIAATNSWLHAQTQRSPYYHDKDKGYVCTLSAMVLKSNTAHLFHIGDARIYRIRADNIEQLTEDHRAIVSSSQSYLGRALGINSQVEIDYQTLRLEIGDIFLLATDGVYEHLSGRFMTETISDGVDDLNDTAFKLVDAARQNGSSDNLTVQIVRIDGVPDSDSNEMVQQAAELPCPPILEPRMVVDGFQIVREIHASSRSHIYLATDGPDGPLVTLKIPSIDLRGDPGYLQRLMMEEWVARRINSAHVLRPYKQPRSRSYLYVVMEFVEGQTLRQWVVDNPTPSLQAVRDITEQIARGLQAFHRLEMLHQDLRPENIMVDRTGTAKIIDFGSTRVAGVVDADISGMSSQILGTMQYTAPEYFIGNPGSQASDIFSLGVIVYQLLTGCLPYGAEMAKARTRAAQKRVHYRSMSEPGRGIPWWIDAAVRKAVRPDPAMRYQELSEFTFDLRNPNQTLSASRHAPLLERNPVLFWKLLSTGLFTIALALLVVLLTHSR